MRGSGSRPPSLSDRAERSSTPGLLITLADGAIRFGVLQLFQYPAPFDELLARVILPQAGYNAALASLAVLAPATRGRL